MKVRFELPKRAIWWKFLITSALRFVIWSTQLSVDRKPTKSAQKDRKIRRLLHLRFLYLEEGVDREVVGRSADSTVFRKISTSFCDNHPSMAPQRQLLSASLSSHGRFPNLLSHSYWQSPPNDGFVIMSLSWRERAVPWLLSAQGRTKVKPKCSC